MSTLRPKYLLYGYMEPLGYRLPRGSRQGAFKGSFKGSRDSPLYTTIMEFGPQNHNKEGLLGS